MHRNIEMAEFAAKYISSLGHNSTECRVLSDVFAESGCQENVQRIRHLMNSKELRKTIRSSKMETEERSQLHRS